jgi:hypothetical protein
MVAEVPEEGFAAPAGQDGEGRTFPGCEGDGEFESWNGRYYQRPGQTLEFWFIDVEGTPVMVEANTFPASPEEDVAELTAVIDSLVLTP